MGIFHPNNNLGLEVFFIGTILMLILEVGFLIWIVKAAKK